MAGSARGRTAVWLTPLVLIVLAYVWLPSSSRGTHDAGGVSRRVPVDVVIAILGIGALVTLLAVLTFVGGALETRPASWSARVAAHLFEHGLDIAVVLLLCASLGASRHRPSHICTR